MLNGLDLFSGIGGLTLALAPWVRPIAYCEKDRYCQSTLLSQMYRGNLPTAPIWDDVATLRGSELSLPIDVIYGGFPCQDISVAGTGRGLEGERSGLVFEVLRLVAELRPTFVFFENVPAIRSRGAERVVKELAGYGYDSRWCVVSAADVGAPHLRKRWFLLAYAKRESVRIEQQREAGGRPGTIPTEREGVSMDHGENRSVADADGGRREIESSRGRIADRRSKDWQLKDAAGLVTDWSTEPHLGRVADGVPFRVDRLRGLGNAVVPLQARTAFQILAGLQKGIVT